MSTPPSAAAANDTGLFKVNFNPFLPVTRGCGTGPTRICSPPTSLCVDVVSVSPWLSDFHSTRFLTAPGGGCAGFEWWAGRAVSAHAAAVVAGSPGFVNGGGGTQLSADALGRELGPSWTRSGSPLEEASGVGRGPRGGGSAPPHAGGRVRTSFLRTGSASIGLSLKGMSPPPVSWSLRLEILTPELRNPKGLAGHAGSRASQPGAESCGFVGGLPAHPSRPTRASAGVCPAPASLRGGLGVSTGRRGLGGVMLPVRVSFPRGAAAPPARGAGSPSVLLRRGGEGDPGERPQCPSRWPLDRAGLTHRRRQRRKQKLSFLPRLGTRSGRPPPPQLLFSTSCV